MPEYLLISDFDGTQFRTFDPSPNNIGVCEAYELAIDEVFGSVGKAAYYLIGGLENRSPYQLVEALMSVDPELSSKLTSSARRFLENQAEAVVRFIPEAKGGEVTWDENSEAEVITQLLVGAKLNHLYREIGSKDAAGQMWPQPTPGFLEFIQDLQQLNGRGINLTLADISSGHDVFIKKTFEVWGLPQPDILVTEDTIRPLKQPRESARKYKPGQVPLALAHLRWAKQIGLVDELGNLNHQAAVEAKQRMVLFGDDHIKDGQLAERGRILFGHMVKQPYPRTDEIIPPYATGLEKVMVDPTKAFVFWNWKQISRVLCGSGPLLDQGKPLSEIFQPLVSLTSSLKQYD